MVTQWKSRLLILCIFHFDPSGIIAALKTWQWARVGSIRNKVWAMREPPGGKDQNSDGSETMKTVPRKGCSITVYLTIISPSQEIQFSRYILVYLTLNLGLL